MASTFNAGTQANIQSLLRTIAQITGKDINLANSASFKVELESPDGQVVNMRVTPGDQGLSTKLMGKAGGELVIPSGGPADLDGDYGTTTLVASTKAVTVPGGVPVGSLVYATVTTAAGVSKLLAATRTSATQITIQSPAAAATAFKNVATTDGVASAALSGGTIDVALVNAVGDLLACTRLASAGTPGVLSVKRKNGTEVTVESWLAGTGLQVLDTSTVTVYNLAQAAHETSIVRWAVIRP